MFIDFNGDNDNNSIYLELDKYLPNYYRLIYSTDNSHSKN